MNTQYKKGVLELCVLSLLHKRDHYGYEISDFLSQHIDIADGTVYPILRKLKADVRSRFRLLALRHTRHLTVGICIDELHAVGAV